MIKGVIWDSAYREPSKQGDLVSNPIDQLEWVMRLQNNFVENIVQYDIALSGYGSIDSTTLDELRTIVSSRELLNENEMTTDYLIKSLCKEFFLINWQNGSGQECLEYIFKPRANEFSFSFDEIFDITTIKPPSKYNIYVEPIINYAYDYATERYTKQARVLGITTETSWSSALTPGFTASDGETIWNKCKRLYNHYGHYEPMPEELTNKQWITEYADAFWWINRYYGLEISGFCDWSRCSIDVGYYDALYSKQVDIGMIGTINLPHQTGGLDMQCMIESITPKKREKVVTLDIILLDTSIETVADMWQDNDDSGEIIQGGDTGEIIQEN
jgi:hypothetical protein